jgi:hypothetical protein
MDTECETGYLTADKIKLQLIRHRGFTAQKKQVSLPVIFANLTLIYG